MPHFEELAPVYVQQDCKAAEQQVHNPKPGSDVRFAVLESENVVQDVRAGIMDTLTTPSKLNGAGGGTRALVGADFLYYKDTGSGKRALRNVDRQKAELRPRQCRKCKRKWLRHEFDQAEGRMCAVCMHADCRAVTRS